MTLIPLERITGKKKKKLTKEEKQDFDQSVAHTKRTEAQRKANGSAGQ